MKRHYRTLAEYFTQSGKTQDALAARLGVSRPYISMIAAGRRQPSLALALEIEKVTGVPVESLVAPEMRV